MSNPRIRLFSHESEDAELTSLISDWTRLPVTQPSTLKVKNKSSVTQMTIVSKYFGEGFEYLCF